MSGRRVDAKGEALRRQGLLHPHPDRIRDEAFQANAFFDRRDLVQVRYEMLRRHRKEDVSVTEAAKRFGVTRPTFYQLADAYDRQGLYGLVPRKRGPKGPRRCTPDILDFVRKRQAETPRVTLEQLLGEVKARFGVSLHRRTLERGLANANARKGGRPAKSARRTPRPKGPRSS